MVDIAKATKVLEDYFANVTKDQFSSDLTKFCPELFEEEEEQAKVNEDRSASTTIDREQQDNLPVKKLHERGVEHLTDLYQQAQKDGKLQIAPKLLNKGLSIQEVAELLELDIHNVEETALAHGIQV